MNIRDTSVTSLTLESLLENVETLESLVYNVETQSKIKNVRDFLSLNIEVKSFFIMLFLFVIRNNKNKMNFKNKFGHN